MAVGGIAEIIHAFTVTSWSGFFFWLLSGLLYAIAGFIAFTNPLLAAMVLTLILAVSLLVSGVSRIVGGFRIRPESGWAWIVASGVATAIVGLLLTIGWPLNTLWLLGLVLGLDLIFQGVASIAFGLSVKTSVLAGRRAKMSQEGCIGKYSASCEGEIYA
jgi:uncharacterized membrane protein HdeD (DUF308 family)